jgi:hypothetical protein
MEKPTLDVEVARAEMFKPRSVVVPVDEISRAEIEDVAYVVADDVERKNDPPIPRSVQIASVDAPVRASCGCVVEAMFNFQNGVVVPIPRDPTKKELFVVVEIKEPTVSCDDVAERTPDALEVMIELIGYVPVLVMKPESLLNHESLTEDEAMVLTCPLLPVYAKPCESEGR